MSNKDLASVPQALLDVIDADDPQGIRHELSGLPVNNKAQILNAALGFAVVRRCREAAVCLLIEGANTDLHGHRGACPIHMAARLDAGVFVELLLSHGADPDVQDFGGATALHDAAMKGAVTVVRKLLEAGASPDIGTSTDITPLMFACHCGHRSIAEMLIRRGADVNGSDRAPRGAGHGDAVLHYAARGGDVECVRLLLAHDADPLVRGKFGKLPVQVAAEMGYPKIVDLLGKHSGDAGRATSKEQTEADTLASSRVKAMAMDRGSRRAMARALTGSALHDAAALGETETVRSLLASGCDANARDRYGFCSLHKAAQFGRLDVIRLLVQAGASVDDVAKTRAGARPLHYAAGYGEPEAVALLLELGADPAGLDAEGKPPIDWATSSRAYVAYGSANARSAEILRRR